jgi:SNF2 family DNA or RNA helicase
MSAARPKPLSNTLSEGDLRQYQRDAITHVLEHPDAMLWVDMGLGKTAVALTAFLDLQDRGLVTTALVVAPLRIIQTVWEAEARKWQHTRRLRFSLVHGTVDQRLLALRRPADIYLINPENAVWLASQAEHLWTKRGKRLPWSMLILDEVTRFKNSTAKRSKAMQALAPGFARRIGLTGEPAANGYPDLYGQYRVIDLGKALGTTVTAFRNQYLKQSGYSGFGWACTRTGKEGIRNRIAGITLEQSAMAHLDLPPLVMNTLWVDLPPAARKVYDRLERDFFVELDAGGKLEVVNQASLLNKLCQVASGAAYLTVGGPWQEIHTAKMDALEDLLEESGGRPVLCGHTYRHEAERIATRFPDSRHLSSDLSKVELEERLAAWGRDEIPLLVGHPASMGHGLQLQGSSARALVWFSLPWSLELYNQMAGRLFGGHRRQGASVMHHIVARGTVDEVILSALQAKSTTQDSLKLAISSYRARKGY